MSHYDIELTGTAIRRPGKPREETAFLCLISIDEGKTYQVIDLGVLGRTRDEAKRRSLERLQLDPYWASHVFGEGVTIDMVPRRSFHPEKFGVVPQPGKITRKPFRKESLQSHA